MSHPERRFFVCLLLLCAFGLFLVFSASVAEAYSQFGDKFYFVRKQALWMFAGLAGLVVTALLPPTIWRKVGLLVFLAAIGMLIAVLLPGVGKTVQGAQRWISLGFLSFQPAEFVKLAVVLYFPVWLVKHQRPGPFVALTGILILLLLIQPDLGTALVTGSIAFGLYIGSGAKTSHIIRIAVAGVAGVLILILISPYRMERLTTFLRMDIDPLGDSYHIRQIVIALGSGGWFGQGIGQSRQKYQYIPEASTDSIFAIAGEEIGFLGSLLILAIYVFLLRFAFQIVEQTLNPYLKLLALGIVFWIGSQMLLNLASVVALVPLTGVPLPFVSYGGSALLSILASSGILISIGRSQHT